MSNPAITWARKVRNITSAQKLVLLLLADSYNEEKAEAWPSAVALAADAGLSDRTVRTVLDALEAAGLITGEHHKWKATRWTLNMQGFAGAAPPSSPLNGVHPPPEAASSPTPEADSSPPEVVSSPPCSGFRGPLKLLQTEPLRTQIEPLEGKHTPTPCPARPPAERGVCVVPPAQQFWNAYPRQEGGPRAAMLAHAAAIGRGATHAELMAALERAVWPDNPRFIPFAKRWLDEERWRDAPPARRFADPFMQLEYEDFCARQVEGPPGGH